MRVCVGVCILYHWNVDIHGYLLWTSIQFIITTKNGEKNLDQNKN